MTVSRPFRRTCRPFKKGNYGGTYFDHKKFAVDPQHYIRAYLILQNDLENIFSYVEPADSNLDTYSHRIQQLLMRCCVEVEANLTAILNENNYTKRKMNDWTMTDYKTVEFSHRLSSYKVRLPGWNGKENIYQPFKPWKAKKSLPWYDAYNKSKHDRHNNFSMATFKALIASMCGLTAVITAQFFNNEYHPGPIGLAIEYEGYDSDDGMISAVGEMFRVGLPDDWPEEERYDFDWSEIKKLDDPFDEFDYSSFS